MTVTASGLFTATMASALGAAQLAVNWESPTNRCALFPNTITPNFDASPAAYGAGQYLAANEISGTGYTAGGTLLTGQTVSAASGTVTYDAANTTWSGITVSGARCALLYAAALAGKNAFVLVTFGDNYSTVNGLFEIDWASAGILALDLTP